MTEVLRIERLGAVGLATVMAQKGVAAGEIGRAIGIVAPDGPRCITAADTSLIGVGPGTWLIRRDRPPPLWIDELRGILGGLAAVSDQSSAYSLWRLSGPSARQVLQRGAATDLHPLAFAAGSVATTVIAHIGVIIRQLDELPSYELATFRSYADSFGRWLEQAGAAS